MLDIERQAERANELLQMPDVREAMTIRCQEEGHDFENACTAMFQIFQVCKWCGWTR